MCINADQQREATADLRLAVDFLRQEYADQLAAGNYSDLNSVPLMLTWLRRAKHRQADPAHPEVSTADPLGAAPVASSVESTPLRRHWRRRRLRRGGIQQSDYLAVTSVSPVAFLDSSRPVNDLEKAPPIERVTYDDSVVPSEVASATTGRTTRTKDDEFEETDLKLEDERAEYAQRLLRIAHGLHFGSIAILGVFVVQVRIICLSLPLCL